MKNRKVFGYRGFDIEISSFFDQYRWNHTTLFGCGYGSYFDSIQEALEGGKASVDRYIAGAQEAADRWKNIDIYSSL